MRRRLLILFNYPLLCCHIDLHVILFWRVIHAYQPVELLPALDFTSFMIPSHSCSNKRTTLCLSRTRIKAEVIISELSAFALHIVHRRQVAQSAELGLLPQDLIDYGATVAYPFPAVGPLAHELLCIRLYVVGWLTFQILFSPDLLLLIVLLG